MDNLRMVFLLLLSNWSYIEYFKTFKTNEFILGRRTFLSKASPEVGCVIQVAKSIPRILGIWATL